METVWWLIALSRMLFNVQGTMLSDVSDQLLFNFIFLSLFTKTINRVTLQVFSEQPHTLKKK